MPGTTFRPSSRGLDPAALAPVDDLIAQRVRVGGRTLLDVSGELADVVESVRSLVGGGKRLRAAFCVWGATGVAGDPAVAGSVEAAAALELFHLGALVHDDVMDRSEARRGVASVHHDHAIRHRRRGLAGSSTTFGDGVGVLVGDLCLTWADDLLAAALRACPADRALDVRRTWEEMRTQVLAGQYLDLVTQARPGASVAQVTRVLHFKSAKYTVEHPLRLGAALAGAGAALTRSYAELGIRVGEAFQLRDDLLGVAGDPAVTGKSNLDDVREGKRTLLVALAEQTADPGQLAVLGRHLGDPHLDEAGLLAVRRVLRDTGAVDAVEERIATLVAEAHDVLDRMPASPRAREALADLTDACAWRAA